VRSMAVRGWVCVCSMGTHTRVVCVCHLVLCMVKWGVASLGLLVVLGTMG